MLLDVFLPYLLKVFFREFFFVLREEPISLFFLGMMNGLFERYENSILEFNLNYYWPTLPAVLCSCSVLERMYLRMSSRMVVLGVTFG